MLVCLDAFCNLSFSNVGYTSNVSNVNDFGNYSNIGNISNVGNFSNINNVSNAVNFSNIGNFSNVGNFTHMLGRAIWDKLPECIFKNFEISPVKQGQFQNFQKLRG